MTVDIELDGHRRSVDVRPVAAGWEVTLDRQVVSAAVAEIGGRWSLLIGSRSYEVAFEPAAGSAQVVHVNGEPISLRVLEPRALVGRRSQQGGNPTGPTTVAAPMPGRVVKVLVRPGDTVAARQGVIVVEAMKMENELRSPRAGTVKEIRAVEGASVEAGAVLVVLE